MRSIPKPHKPGNVRDLLVLARPIVDLPERLGDLLDLWDRLDKTHAGLTEPESPPVASQQILEGADPLELMARDRDYRTALEDFRAAQTVVHQVRQRQVAAMDEYLRDHADDVVEGPVRDAVDDLLGKARKQVDKLDKFAPDFPRDAILSYGTPTHLKAHQDAAQLQQTFDVTVALWDHTLTQAFVNNPTYKHRRADLPDGPAGIAVWTRPDLVHDTPLREGIDGPLVGAPREYVIDLLRIAAAPTDAGYRLASPREVIGHYDQIAAAEHEEALKHRGRARILDDSRTGRMVAW